MASITPRWLTLCLEWVPVEAVKERQESELINNPEYGLLANVDGDLTELIPTAAVGPVD